MRAKDTLFEVPPLSDKDCFFLVERRKKSFSYPIHMHKEYELNFVENATHAQRIVGDSIEEIGNRDMVLITGKELEHAWVNGENQNGDIYEVTIQFHPELFSQGFINTTQFLFIKKLFDKASYGVAFSEETIERSRPIIQEMIHHKDTFQSVVLFLSLLNELSKDANMRILSHTQFAKTKKTYESKRICKIMEYLGNNYKKPIRLIEVATLVNMSEASFSRFIKLRTGKNFVDCLNDIRISVSSRRLVDEPTVSISEIAYSCGFNNLSNFNRIFKKKKGFTPKEFRECYVKKKIIV